jgi:hypothetical protein
MSHQEQGAQISAEMRECIENCSACHEVCTETLAYGLSKGAEHAAAEHIGALLDCAQTCDASRDFMLRGSPLHHRVCGVCAQACERCAESCERLGADDELLRACAETCRRCAETCRAMARE